MTPSILHYNGYVITSRLVNDIGQVAVFDPRFKRDPAIYRTTSLDLAMRFVDAYRAGQHWAVDAALTRLREDDAGRNDKHRANLSEGW